MSKHWEQLTVTPHRLWILFREGLIQPAGWDAAQHIAGYVPGRQDWRTFIDRSLLALGTTFLLAGIFFFFAFNWADFSRFDRFNVLQAAVVIAAVMTFILKIDTWGGRMLLAATTLLIGATLAVVGQAYQTGADNYQLFLTWTLFITGLVLISRWNIMWLIWMVLINITIGLYWWQVIGSEPLLLSYLWISINLIFVLIWDVLAARNVFAFMKQGRWFLYLFILYSIYQLTALMFDYIFTYYGNLNEYDDVFLNGSQPFVYIGVVLALAVIYSQFWHDLPVMTLLAISVLIVIVTTVARMTINDGDTMLIFFVATGFVALAATAVMFRGLQLLHARWESES